MWAATASAVGQGRAKTINCDWCAGRHTLLPCVCVQGKPLVRSKLIFQLGGLVYAAIAATTNFARAADTSGELPSNPATAAELPQITVISNTPLEGLGLPLNQIPANVQTANS